MLSGVPGDGFVDVETVLHVLGTFAASMPLLTRIRLSSGSTSFHRRLHTPTRENQRRKLGKLEQGFRFVFEGGDLFVHHVHEDDPRFVVLGALEGEEVHHPHWATDSWHRYWETSSPWPSMPICSMISRPAPYRSAKMSFISGCLCPRRRRIRPGRPSCGG